MTLERRQTGVSNSDIHNGAPSENTPGFLLKLTKAADEFLNNLNSPEASTEIEVDKVLIDKILNIFKANPRLKASTSMLRAYLQLHGEQSEGSYKSLNPEQQAVFIDKLLSVVQQALDNEKNNRNGSHGGEQPVDSVNHISVPNSLPEMRSNGNNGNHENPIAEVTVNDGRELATEELATEELATEEHTEEQDSYEPLLPALIPVARDAGLVFLRIINNGAELVGSQVLVAGRAIIEAHRRYQESEEAKRGKQSFDGDEKRWFRIRPEIKRFRESVEAFLAGEECWIAQLVGENDQPLSGEIVLFPGSLYVLELLQIADTTDHIRDGGFQQEPVEETMWYTIEIAGDAENSPSRRVKFAKIPESPQDIIEQYFAAGLGGPISCYGAEASLGSDLERFAAGYKEINRRVRPSLDNMEKFLRSGKSAIEVLRNMDISEKKAQNAIKSSVQVSVQKILSELTTVNTTLTRFISPEKYADFASSDVQENSFLAQLYTLSESLKTQGAQLLRRKVPDLPENSLSDFFVEAETFLSKVNLELDIARGSYASMFLAETRQRRIPVYIEAFHQRGIGLQEIPNQPHQLIELFLQGDNALPERVPNLEQILTDIEIAYDVMGNDLEEFLRSKGVTVNWSDLYLLNYLSADEERVESTFDWLTDYVVFRTGLEVTKEQFFRVARNLDITQDNLVAAFQDGPDSISHLLRSIESESELSEAQQAYLEGLQRLAESYSSKLSNLKKYLAPIERRVFNQDQESNRELHDLLERGFQAPYSRIQELANIARIPQNGGVSEIAQMMNTLLDETLEFYREQIKQNLATPSSEVI